MKVLRTPCTALILTLVLISLSNVAYARTGGLTLSKPSINFGNVVMGGSTVVVERIFNPAAESFGISSASIVEGSSYQLSGSPLPVSIDPRGETDLYITFKPSEAGVMAGSLQISPSTGDPITIPLYGTGVSSGLLTANPPSVNFGSTADPITETLTNTGGTVVTIYAVGKTGSGFVMTAPQLPVTLRPNESTTLNVSVVSPGNAGANGTISVSTRVAWWAYGQRGAYQYASRQPSSASLQIPVSGTAVQGRGQLTSNPSSISFGTSPLRTTVSHQTTLTNSGGGPIAIIQASASGSGFALSGLPIPTILNAGESVTFPAGFTPQAAGAVQGGISIVSNASDPTLNIQLSGSGIALGQLNLFPSILSFGNVTVGQSQTLTGTLAASGSSVTILAASVSNPEFSLGGIQLPATISPGQSIPYSVTFTPQVSGTTSANVAFASNGATSTSSEALTGAGAVAIQQHNVMLAWTADAASVAGYNVYRGTQAGGPYAKVTSAPTSATTYGDSAVSAGQTYFYVTTAVDTTGNESSHSNEVQASIPTP